VAREVVPLLDLAQDDLGRRHLAVAQAVEDAVDVVRLNAMEDQQRLPGTQMLTSGSSAQKPKQPTGTSWTARPRASISEAKAWKTASAPLPEPHVPMPTAMRGLLGMSFARPASRTAENAAKS